MTKGSVRTAEPALTGHKGDRRRCPDRDIPVVDAPGASEPENPSAKISSTFSWN